MRGTSVQVETYLFTYMQRHIHTCRHGVHTYLCMYENTNTMHVCTPIDYIRECISIYTRKHARIYAWIYVYLLAVVAELILDAVIVVYTILDALYDASVRFLELIRVVVTSVDTVLVPVPIEFVQWSKPDCLPVSALDLVQRIDTVVDVILVLTIIDGIYELRS